MGKDLEYYLNLEYEIKLKKLSQEEGDGWFAEIPLLPGCMSDGESLEEAVENLGGAKREWIEASLELGREIPEPTTDEFSGQLRVRMPKSLHRTLSQMAKDENVSLNQLIIHQLSKGIGYRL
ncbi:MULTISPECIES: toxin-antitoxin system HicB family antitoxin [Desulfitobacterium]|nr:MULTISPECIES: toxin-antitoxin system HicB family antitoxin [Desulfitobacterium]